MAEVEKQGKTKIIKIGTKISKFLLKFGIDIRRKLFKQVLDKLGGNLRFIISGASAIDRKVAQGFNDFGILTVQGYGLTETAPVLTAENEKTMKLGSVGIPMYSVDIKIDNPDENGIGEIVAKGPNLMLGYYENEEATNDVIKIDKDGNRWFHTGDLGYIDKDGFLFIVGRVKRMITRFDGHKVFPINIENLVSQHPLVRNCCVIETNDLERSQGHYPLVVVELAEQVQDKQEICKQLYAQCLKELEERGIPVAVISVDKIPLTGALKNDYRLLGEQLKNFDYLSWQNTL